MTKNSEIINVKKVLGARIQSIRKSKKLTQEQLGELVNIEPQNISMIETGRNYPTPENLAKIAQALDVNVFELFVSGERETESVMREFVISELNRSSKMTRLMFNFCRSVNQLY